MKFTLSWLKEHLETQATLGTIVDTLTMIGLEVERVEDKGKALAPFTIARVISAEQHPNADRLRVCMVDTGSGEPMQVVCGAPNARAGLVGVFAAPGAVIPGKNVTLSVGTIRGVESRGMLCSAFELQLSDDHEGIIELPADAPVGKPYASWAGLADPVIEINLTPNRPDCTGVHGIARDLAAADIGTLKETPIKPIKGEFPCPVAATLDSSVTGGSELISKSSGTTNANRSAPWWPSLRRFLHQLFSSIWSRSGEAELALEGSAVNLTSVARALLPLTGSKLS